MDSRLDGHMVQGHVDEIGICKFIEEFDGSWLFTFQYKPDAGNITIEKGSITVNGVSLTVVNSKENEFSGKNFLIKDELDRYSEKICLS